MTLFMIKNSALLKMGILALSASLLLASGIYGVYKYSQVEGAKGVKVRRV